MTYNVKDLIPHREPMLFVDAVEEVEKLSNIVCRKTFTADDPTFKGHFPAMPVLPGVFCVEALAQSAALLINISLEKTSKETLFYFMSVEGTKFRLPVKPDDEIKLHVALVQNRGHVFKFAGKAFVDGKLVCESTFTAKLEEVKK